MTVTVIDTSQSLFDYHQRVSLDDVQFELRFRWNTRLQAWFVDILDEDRIVLVYARRCVIEWPLLRQARHLDDIPGGELMNVDTTQRGVPPIADDFGTRVLLMYIDQAEFATI